VSTTTPELIRNCRRCSHELAHGALVCDHCHALVHFEDLERLSAEAKALEDNGDQQQARERWLTALPLVPPASTQAEWIKQHLQAFDEAASGQSEKKWAQPQTLASPPEGMAEKSKGRRTTRLNLVSVLSFLAFIGIYSAASGMKFGIGFAVLILLHEMGHFVDIKRRGLPADMPVFLPGLGAYVRWQAMGVSLQTRAEISLAGPLAGFLAALGCAVLWWQTGNPVWATLARVGAILNLLNLIPVWVLDGAQAVLALSKTGRIILLAACLALWLVLGENMFILLALGTGYQIFFAGNLPSRGSRATTVYYLTVLTALGVIIRLMPGTGLGLH
jgi:Zn-dependent protease